MKRDRLFMLLFLLSITTSLSIHATSSETTTDSENEDILSNVTWYTIQNNNSSGGYLSTGSGYIDTDGTLLLTGTTADGTRAGQWTYIGDETNGYRIYNLKYGSNYVLGITGSEASARAKMVSLDEASNYDTYFDRVSNGAGSSLKIHGSDNNYWNKRGNYLALWNSASGSEDSGSRFIFTEVATPKLPYSTESQPHYYIIQFYTESAALADQGSDALVLTETKSATATNQQWALIGNENGFLLKSADNNYLCWNSSSSRFATTSDESAASSLVLVNTTNSSAATSGCYELKIKGQSNCMNQYGGAGVGKQLGVWTAGDKNNPFYLISATMEEPKYSSDDNDHWYFIQFCNSGYVIAAQSTTAGENILTAAVDPIDQQLWRFIGTKDNFQMQNKSGLYAVMKNGTSGNGARLITATEPDASGFSFVQTTNATWTPNPEIKWNGQDGTYQRINQNGGAKLGATLCLWSAGDAGNVISFVDPDTYAYDEFKISGATSFSPESQNTLWYTNSAVGTGVSNPWMEYALPIGNGELGAMVFGGIYKEELQFNEKTLWSGPTNTIGAGSGNRTFMNFGSVFIQSLDTDKFSFGSTYPVNNYIRYLDIEKGVAGVNFESASGTEHQRRYISSAPDQVIAAHYTASGKETMNLLFTLKPGTGIGAGTVTYDKGAASFSGSMTTVSHAARLEVVADEGATITTSEEGIKVQNAGEITFYLKGITNFDGDITVTDTYTNGKSTSELLSDLQSTIDAAKTRGWDAVYTDHVADFSALTKRMTFDMGLTTPTMTTEDLIKNYNQVADAGSTDNDVLFLEQLYFHFGRYLEISSNRKPIAAPTNLQGIWNYRGTDSPWNSDIHTNINVQMNYWPMESTNLSDLHLPFLNFIIRGAQSAGWKNVGTQYNNGYGWSVLTESSLLNSMSTWGSNYLVANVWYTSHLWQHFRFTQDTDFLKQAFPTMWSAAEFWFHRLIEDAGYDSSTQNSSYAGTAYQFDADGTYVAPNEYSPEQDAHNSENGTAHAQQLIAYLFQNLRDAYDILLEKTGAKMLTEDELSKLDEYIQKTDKGLHTETYTANTSLNSQWTNPRNGVNQGNIILREWKYSPYDVSSDPGHRHLSHLMALFPLEQISPESEYFVPAVNSLKLRGDAATGWSMGWKTNLWARALDGDHAHTILHNALKHSTSYSTNQNAGGIYYNLFDSHAPFQIDGNFGVCSGVAEMLLQSAHDYIHILPALPAAWPKGSMTGMKAVGNFTVSEEWENGAPTVVTIVSNKGSQLRVRSDIGDTGNAIVLVNGRQVTPQADEDNEKVYTIPNVKEGDQVTLYYNTDSKYIIPDVNKNGSVSINDMSSAVQLLLNTDSTISITDLQTIKNEILKKE